MRGSGLANVEDRVRGSGLANVEDRVRGSGLANVEDRLVVRDSLASANKDTVFSFLNDEVQHSS